jgi:putative membrane-bound dehydrogenase-like protein
MVSRFLFAVVLLIAGVATLGQVAADDAVPIRILFLGDNGHHRPADRFKQLQPVLKKRGIELSYTADMTDISAEKLAPFDGILIYANTERIEPAQEKALLDFVADGKGLIPLHCASFCFLNSDAYIDLVGAQFERHGTGTFRTIIAEPEHPLMRGFRGFESWDETYLHRRHNEKNRTVLEYRQDAGRREPWTWVRTHEKGRVFYTAWGHDERTWSNPGFQNLVERGIRWATGSDPATVEAFNDQPDMTALRKDVKPFDYVEADVPFYVPGEKWGTTKPGKRMMQLPLSPEESQKHIVTPVGFEAQLFVSEPELQGKPIAMNWDERGRLWVCETVDYPNAMQPEGAGHDRIRICEDTDGDGRADKFTVFADKLSIPTSLTFANGGVIVLQAPDTLFLRDTDGDDVADERKVLFTGWKTNDTHAGPSNLQYGLDGWIYAMVGYAGFEGEVGGEQHNFRQGFFRFKPDGSKLEFLRNTNNNSWGVGFSEEGILFGSTANGNPSEYMPIANRYYEAVRGWSSSVLGGIAETAKYYPITEKVRQVDHHGNFTAAAGHALYTARTYPREYWNRTSFVTGPDGHLAATFVISPRGSDFKSKNSWNLFASDDEWTAPIVAEVGPDGHVWISDWYNYIVQHNPTPAGFKNGKGNAYETDLRDKKHGRIYRVVYTAAKDSPALSLADASPAKLVETLGNDNFFWRRHAQRLLIERSKSDVVPALVELVQNQQVDEIGLNPAAIHALWTLRGLGALDNKELARRVASAGLGHPSSGVVKATIDVLPRSAEFARMLLDSRVFEHEDGQVKLAAVLALAEMPEDMAADAIVSLTQREDYQNDRWLPDALVAAAAAQNRSFLFAAIHQGKKPSQLLLKSASIVGEHFGRGADPAAVTLLRDLRPTANREVLGGVLAGVSKGWPKDSGLKLSTDQEESLVAAFKLLSAEQHSPLIALAKRWNTRALEAYSTEIAKSLLVQLQDDKASENERIAAAVQLIEFRPLDEKAAMPLLDLITPRTSPEFAAGLFDALRGSENPLVGEEIVVRLAQWTPAVRPGAFRALLAKPDWTQALITAAEQGQVRLGDLALDQKQALAAHPDKKLAERAKRLLASGGGLPSADRQKVLEELMPLIKRQGDPANGKQVFTKQCAKCHMHSGEGNKIGPDLTGMAVHPKIELLTHIIDPSRSVEGNFRVYTVATSEGRVLTGLLLSESKTSVELADAEGKKHALQREDIDELIASPKSLMPDGFEKQVSADELVNLLEFLTQRGKYLPIPLDKVATTVTTRGMFWDEQAGAERLIFDDWKPKTVEGVPFVLVDPQGEKAPNAIMLYGPQGKFPPTMPKSVKLPCNAPAKAVHMLSGVSGWGFPLGKKGSTSVVVRLHYEGGDTEDIPLKNGEHFADYIQRVDVPGSKFAFQLRGQQIRYLSVEPSRPDRIESIELIKGDDETAPVVMAVTIEAP